MDSDEAQRVLILSVFNNAMFDIKHSQSSAAIKSAWEFFMGNGPGNVKFREMCEWAGQEPTQYAARAEVLLYREFKVYEDALPIDRKLAWLALHRQNRNLRDQNSRLRQRLGVKK